MPLTEYIKQLPTDITNIILGYCLIFCNSCQGWVMARGEPKNCQEVGCHQLKHSYVVRYYNGNYQITTASDICHRVLAWKSCYSCQSWYCPNHLVKLAPCSAGKIKPERDCHNQLYCPSCSGRCTCGNVGCPGRLCMECFVYYNDMFSQ